MPTTLLSDFGHAESVRLLVAHYFVVGLESEDRVLEEGLAAPVPVEQHREITLDVVLCELFRQLLEVQHGLSDFQAIVIDAVVRILCDAHLFSKKFNTSPEFGNGFKPTHEASAESSSLELCLARRRKTKSIALSKIVLAMVFLWWRGLMTGGLAVSRHLPPPFIET